MGPNELKDWIVTISASFTLISVAVGIWMALREYRLKLRAERRLEKSAEIEAEIRLQKHFTELMVVANGRSGYHVSENAVEYLLSDLKTGKSEPPDLKTLNQAFRDLAILRLPVGSAAQDAAVAAIASLTNRHEILRAVGIQALESLVDPPTSRFAKKYLEELKMNSPLASASPRKE
jgi:hypothetical protein